MNKVQPHDKKTSDSPRVIRTLVTRKKDMDPKKIASAS
jgi:hypothetical protein